jgi:hypothetical protein
MLTVLSAYNLALSTYILSYKVPVLTVGPWELKTYPYLWVLSVFRYWYLWAECFPLLISTKVTSVPGSMLHIPVLRIRIGSNADTDPDPAFSVNADPDPGF